MTGRQVGSLQPGTQGSRAVSAEPAPAGGEALGTRAALRGGPDSRGLPVPTNALTPGHVGTGGLACRGSGDSHRGPEDGRCCGTPSLGALAGPAGPPGLQGAHGGCSARGAGALCQPDGLGPTLAPTRTNSEGSWSQVWDQPGLIGENTGDVVTLTQSMQRERRCVGLQQALASGTRCGLP